MFIAVNYSNVVVHRDVERKKLFFTAKKDAELDDAILEALHHLEIVGFEKKCYLYFQGEKYVLNKSLTLNAVKDNYNKQKSFSL